MRPGAALAAGLLALAALARPPAAPAADAWLERLDRGLRMETAGGLLRAELSGLFDLEGYVLDRRPPGLIFGDDDPFVNPRLSLFLDTRLGSHLYSLVEARIDRGFDPRAHSSAARFDQYLLRYSPLADGRLNLEVGKFATMIGSWAPRHDSWSNPFINAPLPYENVTVVSDVSVPASRGAFLARRALADRKRQWQPVIWGPSYASGAALFGALGPLEYAAEVKNAAPSSRPEVWDGRARGWRHPTFDGRLGWHPAAAWIVGASAAHGAYLRDDPRGTLPSGRDVDDFPQELIGVDASYAWRHWQLWAEFFASRFDVPRVGDADTIAYYVESRYKLTPMLFAALRWNQQLFGEVKNDRERDRAWDRDIWRLDTAVGYRFNRHLQGKLQYSYAHQRGELQQGEQLVAAQLTVKF